ncbi:hypothetical protein P8Q88_14470 [Qipengyuania sp. XHP0207]|uniref:hypothetical protein n=1 Tax=Qipengyuania sp. XHP0207 TaxID=3038078 RepID=UPI00241F1E62|nr:hypothetical protein [Qipengyuania sp. XHP0207]MDG5749380.1 hypothetical protein [Qipengyuania sp. XHP0207]
MQTISLISAALLASVALAADTDTAPEAPADAEARPCDGAYPVFNPEGCPEKPITPADAEDIICRDKIHQVRDANGQPQLRRDAEQREDAAMIKAVDQRIDGCNVMVMHHDTTDIRPLPKPDGEPRLEPAG